MASIQVSRTVNRTRVEGPGLRYSIWVQGCPIQCKDCFNPHTWDMSGGVKMEIDEILADIKESLKSEPKLEGVTFLGGEPFSQAKELSLLADHVKKLNLSIVTFSGYEYEVILKSNNQHWHSLLSQTDLLIDGPFIKEQYDLSRPWIGSKNQKYRFLTDVYKHLEKSLLNIPNKLEIKLHSDGTISANGMAHSLDIDLLHQIGYVRKETHS